MDIVKKIATCAVWIQLSICCLIVMSSMMASRLYLDADIENVGKIAHFLLKHITIQSVIRDDEWSKKYPFEENWEEKYLTVVNRMEKAVNSFCTTSFPGGGSINAIVTNYNDKCLNYHITSIPSEVDNVKYVSKCIDNVVEFSTEINNMGIPFIYVQTPSESSIQLYKHGIVEDDSLNIAERSMYLTTGLEETGLDVLNIARDHSESIVFDRSKHWMPSDGLDCARLIANKLIQDCGFNIVYQIYDDENFYDLFSQYPEIKNEIKTAYGYDFVVPYPMDSPVIRRTYAEGDPVTGTFGEVILNPTGQWIVDGMAYHNVYSIANSLINSLHNDEAVCDRKLLIIGDSFSWPVVVYLSLACKDVTLIHNASFTGSLVSYIKMTKPDVVIVVYNDAELYEMYTEDAYYLR